MEDLADDHLRYFATFVGSLLTSFERYLRSGEPGLGHDTVRYQQLPLWLTDDELRERSAALTELLEPLRANRPDGERRRTLLSMTLFPDANATVESRPQSMS